MNTEKMRGRCFAALLALLLCLSMALPGLAEDKPLLQLSKTAENLKLKNGEYISDVTLSIPAEEERLTTDVVFVLDKSSFSNTKDTALRLLSTLKEQVSSSGAKVNVGIVQFNRIGHPSGWMDLETEYDAIEEIFTNKQSGGTNMHAGLLAAKELLESDTETPDSRKYFVLVSDGDTYLFCKNGDYTVPYSRAYSPFEKAGGARSYGGFYDESYFTPNKPDVGNVMRPKTADSDAWEEYLADVEARNAESNGDQYDFKWMYYDEAWSSNPEKARETYIEQPRVWRSASNTDMAFYNAIKVYQEMAQRYHAFASSVPSLSQDGGKSFLMKYLNGGTDATFEEIQNELLYLISAGSKVVDTMGYVEGQYNFDLYKPDGMTVVLTGTKKQELQAEKIGENHWGFGKTDDGYLYEVTYSPADDGTEKLEWLFNTSVTNFDRVSLNYQVKLMDPETEPGTYGSYDRDGSKGSKELYTNSSAILYPIDSQGKEGEAVKFPMPAVSYTIKGPDPTERPTHRPGNDYKFTFTKIWQADPQDKIYWTLYNPDGSVAHKKFNKKVVSDTEWHYEAWFSSDAEYFLIETVPAGYTVTYRNVGAHANVTDRCFNGGTIINTPVPKTGDAVQPALWLLLAVSALGGILILAARSRKKARS